MVADARSSEQHATREEAIGNDGMTAKFDDEIPFAPCWQYTRKGGGPATVAGLRHTAGCPIGIQRTVTPCGGSCIENRL